MKEIARERVDNNHIDNPLPADTALACYLAGKIAHGVPWRCEALGGFKIEEPFSPTAGDGGSGRAFSFDDEQGALDPDATMRANGPKRAD